MPEWLSIALAVVSVVAPLVIAPLTVTLIVGKSLQKIDTLQQDVTAIKAAIPACQRERREREAELHGRVTALATFQAAQDERARGLAENLNRIERKVNGYA